MLFILYLRVWTRKHIWENSVPFTELKNLITNFFQDSDKIEFINISTSCDIPVIH